MKKNILFTLLLSHTFYGECQSYSNASFYVVAHPNQWQLFMGINTFNDIANGPGNKVIIIYTNAGDSSCSSKKLKKSFYHARQQGADNAVEFCADQWGDHDKWSTNYLTINGHTILTHIYKNVVCYYLFLPDGCNGPGLFGQSLQILYEHPTTQITTVDSSSVYSGWNDLLNTMQNIILTESAGINDLILNTADTDRVINPGDHPDHIYAAILGIYAAAPIAHIKERLFREYVTAGLPVNLSNAEIATESALLSILDYERTENYQETEWDEREVNFTSRNYFRTVYR